MPAWLISAIAGVSRERTSYDVVDFAIGSIEKMKQRDSPTPVLSS